MGYSLSRIVCNRYGNFKQKIGLTKKYLRKGYRVEILDGGFVYAEKGKEVDRGCEVCAEVNFNASRK